MNYQLELLTYLNKIYDKKIEDVLIKEDIDKLKNLNLNEIKSLIKSKEIFLGSDLNEFIINLIPKEFDGYLLREAISKAHNINYPMLYNENGEPLKNYTHNNFATILWQDFTNEAFINDLYNKFNKEDFNTYIDENLDKIYNHIINKVKIFKSENSIVIPYIKNNLVNTFKEMLIKKELPFSYALSVVDMEALRDYMTKFAISLDYYDEFDKLEDDMEECLNNFFKYDEENLLNFLVNNENFVLIDNNKLVKSI